MQWNSTGNLWLVSLFFALIYLQMGKNEVSCIVLFILQVAVNT